MPDDTGKSLSAVLGYLTGRPLKLNELLDALEMTRSTYYVQLAQGRLIVPGNLITAAHNLGINEVDLLARYGFVRENAAREYVGELPPTADGAANANAATESNPSTPRRTGTGYGDPDDYPSTTPPVF